ncbi:hypothetical protein QE374_001973 [Microbacterium sp. SORGH_AS428]|uniref:hypothetical protein n=1 Tax=Microbacterium sp. SORGH_AS_0428 TaxID=3041788 RepID=UPI00285AB7BF|nr:hypothetical protein [Microbacterium sp. SORGH_AS_0428]MDR6200064.1 hypothetical protein [Microbacterium sp. SORGH_AS_0428]
MPDPTEEELARLRARAYGPHADLDEAGLARLAELEATLSPRRPSARLAPEPRPDPEPEPGTVPQPAAAEGTSPSDEPEPVPLIAPVSLTAQPTPRTLDRRLRVAWVLSIVVTAGIAAGVTAWTLPWGVRDDQQHAARLTEQPGVPEGVDQWKMTGLEAGELRSFGSYAGLEVYATDACIIVATAPLTDPGSGSGTCAGAGLEPLVEFHIPRRSRASAGDFGYPEELRDRFPDGIVLRFARHGDVILVDEGELPPWF